MRYETLLLENVRHSAVALSHAVADPFRISTFYGKN